VIIAALSLTSVVVFARLSPRAGHDVALAQETDVQGEIG
jgi:hypothetical protein